MSSITTNEAKVGAVKATTFGTAVAVTDLMEHVSLSVTKGSQELISNNNVNSNFIKSIKRGVEQVDATIAGQANFGGGWHKLMYMLMGATTASPAEVTATEGDYLHNIDFTNAHDLFATMAFHIEDDVAAELPGFKYSSATFRGSANGPIEFSIAGMADRLVLGGTNTVSTLNGLSANQNEEILKMGGDNDYIRMNSQSGSALSSSDDLCVSEFEITITRPIERRFCLRGANTRFTQEPKLTGKSTVIVRLTLNEIDDGTIDLHSIVENATEQKAEFYFAGATINSGTATSDKFQFPRLFPQQVLGYEISGPSVYQQPTIILTAEEANAAPSGMTGVTKPMRLATVNERSSAF